VFYAEPSDVRRLIAMATGAVVGAPLGLLCYSLLRPLTSRGRPVRFVAHFWAWFVGFLSSFFIAVMVAGPHFFDGPTRSGRWVSHAVTAHELIVDSAVIALISALVSVWGPYRYW
jgi:hypothetical protein